MIKTLISILDYIKAILGLIMMGTGLVFIIGMLVGAIGIARRKIPYLAGGPYKIEFVDAQHRNFLIRGERFSAATSDGPSSCKWFANGDQIYFTEGMNSGAMAVIKYQSEVNYTPCHLWRTQN